MQVILVSGRLKTARTLTIMPRHAFFGLALFVGLVLVISAAFSWLSVHLRLPVVQDLVLALQQQETQQTQERVSNNLRLMASRLGELQARVMQLDSLGERLSSVAGVVVETAKPPPKPALPPKPGGQGGPLIEAPLSAEVLQKEIDRLGQMVESKTDELTLLESRILEKRVRDRLLPTTLPVKGAPIGSDFGYRSDPFTHTRALHEGIDFTAETGTPVVAAAAGVVIASEYRADYGNVVDLDHGDGLVSRYAHLSLSRVKAGQMLKRGERIGDVGSTGRSTGPHLHFEVRMLGSAQNPTIFLSQGSEYAAVKRR